MNITTSRSHPGTFLSHLAMYGLGSILESAGLADVRLGWTRSGTPRPFTSAGPVSELEAAELVRAHAAEHSADSWVQRDVTLHGKARGLMSPRLASFGAAATWELVQGERHNVLDTLTAGHRWLDLRFLAALGEPCYWSVSRKNEPLQDDGASRLEMQPRNQGSEFVGSRLRKLAAAVAAREPDAIRTGLRGETVRDEIGGDKPSSRTPTGFASPGPADNALAWCALWGISQYPLAMRVNGTADTSGHLSHQRKEWFYAPVWHDPWRPARLRTMLAARQLRVLAADGLGIVAGTELAVARAWLASRGTAGLVRFPVDRFGSDNAPERRAMSGTMIPVEVMS